MTEEQKRKISNTLKGRPKSPEHIEALKRANNSSWFKKGVDSWMKGKKHNPESIEKNRERGKTKFISPLFSRKGRPVSLEHRKKLSDSHKGEKAYQWKGGISKLNKTERQFMMQTFEYKLWRRAVFERDNYTCIWCGEHGGLLNADHIKPWALFPELRFAIDNGRTLCVSCHKKTDTYGNKTKKSMSVGQLG